MYLVVKQPDGLKLQYSSHRAKVFSTVRGLQGKHASRRVSTQGKRNNLLPLTSQQQTSPALLSAETVLPAQFW